MLRVLADHAHDTLALDDLALVANFLNTGPDFHLETIRPRQHAKGTRMGDTSRDYTYKDRRALRLRRLGRLKLVADWIGFTAWHG